MLNNLAIAAVLDDRSVVLDSSIKLAELSVAHRFRRRLANAVVSEAGGGGGGGVEEVAAVEDDAAFHAAQATDCRARAAEEKNQE
jgi:hypothetical protein